VFAALATGALAGAVLDRVAFVLRFSGADGDDRLLLVNLGRDLKRPSLAEPLLAPPEGRSWTMVWSSEDIRYGGVGTPPVETAQGWDLPGHAAVVLAPIPPP
ncbi:MAG: DUF3459 domain-containing protein, partial [Microvirga sp.]